jgi:hypothetical protein
MGGRNTYCDTVTPSGLRVTVSPKVTVLPTSSRYRNPQSMQSRPPISSPPRYLPLYRAGVCAGSRIRRDSPHWPRALWRPCGQGSGPCPLGSAVCCRARTQPGPIPGLPWRGVRGPGASGQGRAWVDVGASGPAPWVAWAALGAWVDVGSGTPRDTPPAPRARWRPCGSGPAPRRGGRVPADRRTLPGSRPVDRVGVSRAPHERQIPARRPHHTAPTQGT